MSKPSGTGNMRIGLLTIKTDDCVAKVALRNALGGA